MKCQKILFFGIFCLAPYFLDAKRMPGVTRSRNKNNKPSVRRNQHGHEYDDNPLPPVKPKTTDVKKSSPSITNPSAPVGPPPAYPGLNNHNSPSMYGAPPAYNPSYSNPPAYSSGFNHHPPYTGGYNQLNSPVGAMSTSPYGSRSGFGSGIMTNLFAGLAGYQLAKAFTGGGHHYNRDREIIVIDNRQADTSATTLQNTDQINQTQTEYNVNQYSTEIPQIPLTQIVPSMNEYNFWGIPKYGIPLYGYNLPSQNTDYYQTAIISIPPE